MKIKKLISVGLAAVSAFALSTAAMAYSEPTNVTISVPSTDSHKYEAYQIFTGSVDSTTGKLNNIKWGKNGTGTEGAFVSQTDIETLQSALRVDGTSITREELYAHDADELTTIETFVNFDSAPIATDIDNAHPATVASGYYLIKDQEGTTTADEYSQYIVQIANDVIISRKAATDTPTIDKKADGKNGIDAKLGDVVTYTIDVTVPDNIKAFKAYKFIVDDAIDNGLTFESAPKLYFYETGTSTPVEISLTEASSFSAVASAATAQYATSAKTASEKAKMVVTSGDIMSSEAIADKVNSTSKFVISYTAKVNADATFGLNGKNNNTASLAYTNNPNSTEMSTLNTAPDDVTPVYTYKLIITEVDTDGDPIKGMEVKLQRKNDGDSNFTDIQTLTTGDDGVLVFPDLEAGTYKLVETTVPANFTKHDDIVFDIVSSINNEGVLTGLTTTLGSQDTVSNVTADYTTGVISATVSNYASIALPVTGTVGIVLLAGAALAVGGGAIGLRIKSKKEED